MGDVKIKICGITSPSDAVACEELGVDYLGVIFADSGRRVSAARAREIRDAARRTRLVGVFADADLDAASDAARISDLDMIQLHGDESAEYCETLSARTSLPIVKTFRQGEVLGLADLAAHKTVRFFLLDLDKGEPSRGGGKEKLWAEAAWAGERGYRVFLAGGLDPTNVRAAVELTAPYCVDVCRGVEEAPGVKDIEAVRRFITEVRR